MTLIFIELFKGIRLKRKKSKKMIVRPIIWMIILKIENIFLKEIRVIAKCQNYSEEIV